jgi:hypothetical protein
MSLTLSMSASRLVAASRQEVWPVFLEMMGWTHLAGEENPAPRLELCFRPFGIQVEATATNLEADPGRRLSWRGKARGVSVRRDFIFRGAPGGTLVESREQVTGWPLLFLRFFFSPKAMGQANQAWLEELATHLER